VGAKEEEEYYSTTTGSAYFNTYVDSSWRSTVSFECRNCFAFQGLQWDNTAYFWLLETRVSNYRHVGSKVRFTCLTSFDKIKIFRLYRGIYHCEYCTGPSLSFNGRECTLSLSKTKKTQMQLERMYECDLAISCALFTASKRHFGSTTFVMNAIPSVLMSITVFL
jgi:hypothetical protein